MILFFDRREMRVNDNSILRGKDLVNDLRRFLMFSSVWPLGSKGFVQHLSGRVKANSKQQARARCQGRGRDACRGRSAILLDRRRDIRGESLLGCFPAAAKKA